MYYNCNCVIFGTILAAFRVECVLNILDFKCQRCVSSFWCVFGPCCVVCDIFLIFNMIKTKSLPVTSKCWFICSIYIDHVWWSATCSSKCPGFFLRYLCHVIWKRWLWSMHGNVDGEGASFSNLQNLQWFQNHETILHKLFDGWFKLFNYNSFWYFWNNVDVDYHFNNCKYKFTPHKSKHEIKHSTFLDKYT